MKWKLRSAEKEKKSLKEEKETLEKVLNLWNYRTSNKWYHCYFNTTIVIGN